MVALWPAHRAHGHPADGAWRRRGARPGAAPPGDRVRSRPDKPPATGKANLRVGGTAASAVIKSDLSEWDYGDYEGQLSENVWKARPGWNLYRDGCPGGETPAQVSARATGSSRGELQGLEGNVALFSHRQFGCVLAARWIGLPAVEGQHFALGPASLSILGHEASHPGTRVIALWKRPVIARRRMKQRGQS